MAKKIDGFTSFTSEKYDWEKWFDGGYWLLVEGEDFHGKRAAFRSAAYIAAKRRGITVCFHEVENGFEIKSSKPKQKSQ